MENRTEWKKTEIIILGLLAAAVIVAVVKLGSILLAYFDGDSTYESLQEYVFLPEEEPTSPTEAAGQATEPETEPETEPGSDAKADPQEAAGQPDGQVYYGQPPQVDFEALRAVNSDLKGWIYGPGTAINYPIVQGEDNGYYLTHMFNGKENKCGSIFLDCLNEGNFSNTNSILHGHHMKNGSMFAGLTRYADPAYYDAHPIMWLITPEKTYRIEIFTGFVTDDGSDAWQIEFANTEDYQSWLDNMKAVGVFQSDITPETDDKILTLATCSYEYENARFVVMGVLREI